MQSTSMSFWMSAKPCFPNKKGECYIHVALSCTHQISLAIIRQPSNYRIATNITLQRPVWLVWRLFTFSIIAWADWCYWVIYQVSKLFFLLLLSHCALSWDTLSWVLCGLDLNKGRTCVFAWKTVIVVKDYKGGGWKRNRHLSSKWD